MPAPILVRYWLVEKPWLVLRYVKKALMSPEKLVSSLLATKL